MTNFDYATSQTTSETGGRAGFFQYGAVLPLAACVTFGLMVSMASLIATEFQPQDKSETASFEINPVVEDLKVIETEAKIIKAKKVTPPPPPPPIETVKADKPVEKIAAIEGEPPVFIPPKPDTTVIKITVSDKDAQPIQRIPPQMPSRFLSGNHSGYCEVQFDVSPQGKPFNVATTICSASVLKSATLKSIQNWKYNPKIVDGRPVARRGVQTTVRFDLQDDSGEVLPVPSGY